MVDWLSKALVSAVAKHFHAKVVILLLGTKQQDDLALDRLLPFSVEGHFWDFQTFTDFSDQAGRGTDIKFSYYISTETDPEVTLLVCKDATRCQTELLESPPRVRKRLILMTPQNPTITLRLDDTFLVFHSKNGTVFEWHGKGRGTGNQQRPFAHWNKTSSTLELLTDLSIWERRSNLEGLEIRNTVLHWDPVAVRMLSSGNDTTTVGWTGLLPQVLEELRNVLNFTIVHSSPEDGLWGGKVSGNSSVARRWSGMVGELFYGRADVSSGGLGMSAERKEAVEYSGDLVKTLHTLTVKNPGYAGEEGEAEADAEAGTLNSLSFLKIFSLWGWVGMAAAGIALSLAHGFVELRVRLGTFLRGATNFFLALMQLSSGGSDNDVPMDRWSRKLLRLSVLACGFLLFSAFSGDLTATMTAGDSGAVPRDFGEVLKRGYTVVVANGALAVTLLMTAPKDSPKRKVYESHSLMVDYPGDGDLEPLTRQLLDGPKMAYFGAFVQFASDGRLLVVREFRDANPNQFRLAFQKNSEFRDLFNYHLSKLKQSGTLDRLGHLWLFGGRPDDMSSRIFVEEARQIGYENLFLPASLLAGGLVVSLVLTYCEFLRSGLRRQKRWSTLVQY